MGQIALPGGAVVEQDGSIVAATPANDPVRLHTAQALGRLIARWQKPNIRALLATYTDELQEIETMLWDVIVSRFPDYAEGTQLDTLGKIVGEPRAGKSDGSYRARIKARIRINQSFGNPVDVIGVLRTADSAAFRYEELAPAFFRITYSIAAVPAVQAELPLIVSESRPAGVGASVIQPIDRPGVLAGYFTFCDTDGLPLGSGLGFGDTAGTVGGSLSWYARA